MKIKNKRVTPAKPAARAKTRSRRRAPWGGLLGKPIERLPPSLMDGLCDGKTEDEQNAIRSDEDRRVQALQLEKMLKLLRHYGIAETVGWRPWYELALKIASALDDGLKIVDPPQNRQSKTGSRRRGVAGKVRVEPVAAVQPGPDVKLLAVLAELQDLAPPRYDTDAEVGRRVYDIRDMSQTPKAASGGT